MEVVIDPEIKLTKKQIREKYKKKLKEKIKSYSKYFNVPQNIVFTNKETNSWFDIKEATYKNTKTIPKEKLINNCEKKDIIRCDKIIIIPSNYQKQIIINWMDAFIEMYNSTLRHYKDRYFNKKKIESYGVLRGDLLYKKKNDIALRFLTNNDLKTKIPVHILDCSIELVKSHHKTCLTNVKNGHQKSFRIRYIKKTKDSKILDIESNLFSNKYNSFCTTALGKSIIAKKDGIDYDLRTVTTQTTLHYNKKEDIFTLLVPKYEEQVETKGNKYIGIDPGMRTFLTGISKNKIIQIGNNVSERIKKNLKKIDYYSNNSKISKRKRNRYLEINYKKIRTSIEDMHWKAIKELMKYKHIYIGNWSTKETSSKENSKLSAINKRISQNLSYYKFTQRLKYKCEKNKINVTIVHEGYTSKLCSNCGWENEKLGKSKIFKCKECKKIIDRDINGSKNMIIKSL